MKPSPGRWALVGCWMAVNIWLSHQSHLAGPSIPGADKAEHLVEYAIFAFLLARAWFPLLSHRTAGDRTVLLVVTCLLWGVGDEIHQSFIPGRSAETLDVLADTTGGLLVALLLRVRGRPVAGLPTVGMWKDHAKLKDVATAVRRMRAPRHRM